FALGHSLTLSLAVLGAVQANRGAVECLIGLTIALAAADNLIRSEREGRFAGLAAIVITGALLLIPADRRPDLPAALILSIALAAGSAICLGGAVDPSTRGRFLLAAGFGLIHGLGFANVLQDLSLPRALLLPSLAGFNIGVEIGQLLVVGLMALLVGATKAIFPTLARRSEPVTAMASAALLALGIAWFLTRAVSRAHR